jgi:S1-C subfamily serine protease
MTTNYPYFDPAAAPQPFPPPAPSPGPQSGLTRRRRVLAGGIATLTAAAVVGVLAFAGHGSTVDGVGSATRLLPTNPGDLNHGQNGRSTSVGLATAAQQKGVVTVVSVLRYQNAESAGTGMILTSNGEILTNNHVIDGATSVTVTIASTGKSYRADVVGTDPSDDVAVLQLRGASGLATANVGDSSGVSVGDAITGVGNAGGTGTLRAARGTITALNQSITASDETGQDAEKLSGLIQVKAAIVAGDSGGPLYDSAGDIVGMDTAASANQVVDSTAYAIPIDSALKIADEIESGVETSTIHIGLPAFLGVGLEPSISSRAVVSTPLQGGPAGSAGITSGSVITSVDGKKITTAASLKKALQNYQPGQKISVGWTDASGNTHTATVTLASGPAD